MNSDVKREKKPEKLDLNKFSEGIKKSGFPLEYQTARVLKAEGWTVISSKYYLDDVTQTPREMDLIAYKVSTVQEFKVYTTLIVSCKKSESDVWALLSRKLDKTNPNFEWWPLHLWTNNKAINQAISLPGRKLKFHQDAEKAGVNELMSMPQVDVFAFQLMNAASGAVQNDKPIYDSIQSLGYAQAYELSALPDRKKEPAVYQFNLLTVIEADLVRLYFDDDKITPSLVNSEHYIARYIIQKQQSSSRINFVKASELKNSLKSYNLLHIANCRSFEQLENEFFYNVVQDSSKLNLYIEEFKTGLRPIWALVYLAKSENIDLSTLELWWSEKGQTLELGLYKVNEELFEFLNSDEKVKKHVKQILSKIYRYTGAFIFVDAIPF